MPPRFSVPSFSDRALEYVRLSLEEGEIGGDGPFTRKCAAILHDMLGKPALLTHSCTAALEMAAILCDIGPGDEVIMPSYTFVSTANAFAMRGARPVFVDIRDDTLNLDERLLESALTPKTRAIVPVHYAGVACEMDAINEFAAAHGLKVIEDAAQGLDAYYRGKPLGTLGTLGSISFHVTKNVVCGEGGALVINDPALEERAHIVREKGTNRTAFFKRKVAKYEWLDIGSSFLPADVLAALLLSQLEMRDQIRSLRLSIWNRYHIAFADFERQGIVRRPIVPAECDHNAHIYYLLLPDARRLGQFRDALHAQDVGCLTHYVQLHASPAGRKYGRTSGSMAVTDWAADTLIRLPVHNRMTIDDADRVIEVAVRALQSL